MTSAQSLAALDARQFAAYQRKRRKELWKLLGDLPAPREPRVAKVRKIEEHDSYTLEDIELDLNGVQIAPAYVLIPKKRRKKAPALLYIHAHGGRYDFGRDELLQGRRVLPAYAPMLAEKGIVTLAIDSWCFGERKVHADGYRGEGDTFKHMLWHGQTLWGMMMFDEIQALTYLCSRPEVNPKRVGAFGLSMGSTKAWWLAALDARVRLCVDECCLTDFEELIKIGNLSGHNFYYFVPNQMKQFQTSQINELIVPRAHLSLNGRTDLLTPPAGVERVRNHVTPLYRKYGSETDCSIDLFDCGHEEIPPMREKVSAWFDRHLLDR